MIRFAKKKERGEELGRVGEVLQISPYSPLPSFRLLQKEISHVKSQLPIVRKDDSHQSYLIQSPCILLVVIQEPKGVAADIERLKNKFLWRSQQD